MLARRVFRIQGCYWLSEFVDPVEKAPEFADLDTIKVDLDKEGQCPDDVSVDKAMAVLKMILDAHPKACVVLYPRTPLIGSSPLVDTLLDYMLTHLVGRVKINVDNMGQRDDWSDWEQCTCHFMTALINKLGQLTEEQARLAKENWKSLPWIFESTECRTCQKEAWEGWAHPCRDQAWAKMCKDVQKTYSTEWPIMFCQRD